MKAPRERAFSLVELIATVGTIGVIAAVSIIALVGWRQGVDSTKLTSDVQTLNSAVSAYQSFHGKVTASDTAETVLAKLKTKANAESAKKIAGLTGSLVDERMTFSWQTAAEAATSEPRAYWDSANLKFTVATSGPPGIKSVRFDSTGDSDSAATETRNPTMSLAVEDDWIWDYEDRAPASQQGPSNIPTNPSTGGTGTGYPGGGSGPGGPGGGSSGGGSGGNPSTLQVPLFTVTETYHPISDFPLGVGLTNPNPSGSSEIIYSTDGYNWNEYTPGVLFYVDPLDRIFAKAVSVDTDVWRDSGVTNQDYDATPEQLIAPTIIPSSGVMSEDTIYVQLTNPNDPEISVIEYRIDGGPWTSYDGTFSLSSNDYDLDIEIEARAVPTTDYYTESSISSDLVVVVEEITDLSGSVVGLFSNPGGDSTMVTNLHGNGQSNSYFTWGSATGANHVSSLDFAGSDFSSINEGVAFQLGSLSYYNGTISSGTGADSVSLGVELDFVQGGKKKFDFSFDLINTSNNSDPNADPWLSADYVQIDSAVSTSLLKIGSDNYYEFTLIFGETTSYGLSNFDEFHVQENQSASVAVWGVFEKVDPPSKGKGNGNNGNAYGLLDLVDEVLEDAGNAADNAAGVIVN